MGRNAEGIRPESSLMFEQIRSHRRWLQFVLLLLILPSFVFIGFQGYTNFQEGESALASVNDESITQQEYDNALRMRLDELRGALGAQFDPALFDAPELRQSVLDELIHSRVLALAAHEAYFSTSDQRLRDTISRIPSVQADGRFSNALYREALAAQGMTPAMFENQLRRDLAVQQVLSPVADSVFLSDSSLKRLIAAVTEERQIQLKAVAAKGFESTVELSDADLKAYYDANAARFEVPESVDAQYVILDEQSLIDGIQVSDADLQSYYEQNQARFGQAEQRRASHILVLIPEGASADEKAQLRQQAEGLAAQAKAEGADFAVLAREHSEDPGSAQQGGDLDWFERGMMVKAFDDTVFALEKEQISDVVESEFGFHVIKLTDIRPAVVKPLAEVKEQILSEIQQQQSARRFAELAEEFTNQVYEQSDSLEPVASAMNLKIESLKGVQRSARGNSGEIATHPRVIEALFSGEVLNEKRNSGVIELAPGRLVAVRVGQHHPRSLQPFEKVEEQIKVLLRHQRALELARQAGQKELESLKADGSSAGFSQPLWVSRQNTQAVPTVMVEAVMRASVEALPRYVGAATDTEFVIARISEVKAGAQPNEQQVQAEQMRLERFWAEAEQKAVLEMLREKYKVKLTDRGRSLIAAGMADE